VSGIYSYEYLCSPSEAVGGRSQLVVYWSCNTVGPIGYCAGAPHVKVFYMDSLATDLNLHVPPTSKPQNEKQEREILNRTRVWMNCCNLDRSTATQFGKPATIKDD